MMIANRSAGPEAVYGDKGLTLLLGAIAASGFMLSHLSIPQPALQSWDGQWLGMAIGAISIVAMMGAPLLRRARTTELNAPLAWDDNNPGGSFPPNKNAGTQAATLALQSSLLDQIALVHEMTVDGRITRVNELMCAKTGISFNELTGAKHDLINLDVSADRCWRRLHNEVAPGELWIGETLNRTRDGSDLWLSSTIAAVRDGAGVLTGYICASIDVTERSRLREEFDRNGKLMQLGQLTATVAHEIRNPLGAIRTANYVLERKIKGKVEGVEAQLERINNGISRCDKIISELLDFSRKKTIKATARSVDDWVTCVVDEEGKNLYGAPQVTCHLGLGGLEASFDPDQMRQVLINLLSNAAEALGEKIKSGVNAGFTPEISIRTVLDGPFAKIIVEDNGPGIDPKNIKRIREPLFTTKSFGVGLGIPAIEKILENHGGQLSIESNFGCGASITASFLRQTPSATAA